MLGDVLRVLYLDGVLNVNWVQKTLIITGIYDSIYQNLNTYTTQTGSLPSYFSIDELHYLMH